MDSNLDCRPTEKLITVKADSVRLTGKLAVPEAGKGVVLFAHGGNRCPHCNHNHYVAQFLHQVGLATLQINLLTSDEQALDIRTRHFRYDIGFLAARLVGVTDWLIQTPDTQHLKIGYFGASAGSAAALIAAAARPKEIGAVVSRAGWPDLAGSALSLVKAPTLLIVGGIDFPTIGMNQDAWDRLRCQKQLKIIAGASHLFMEPGALEEVASLAGQWFQHYLRATNLPHRHLHALSLPANSLN